ncbi:MAG: pyridoxine 5'-phosphate synthase [Desulfobacteraceae bacterium]|nr:pyridoxine 5'-phosphate synthase [Desulfobacteraceae bacterium]
MAGIIVSVDHIARIREACHARTPDPIAAAVLAELAGADGIAMQLDEVHLQSRERDIRSLRKVVHTQLVIYMRPTSEMVGIALDLRPDLIVLIPETGHETLPENGLDLVVHKKDIAETASTLQDNSIPVGISIDAELEQVKLAHQLNVGTIELHVGAYNRASSGFSREQAFSQISNAANLARKLRMNVNLGQGLTYKTMKAFSGLREIDNFSVGHSIVARAILKGMEAAVSEIASFVRGV